MMLGTHASAMLPDKTSRENSSVLDYVANMLISFGFILVLNSTNHYFILGYILPCAVLTILLSVFCILMWYDLIEINNTENDNA